MVDASFSNELEIVSAPHITPKKMSIESLQMVPNSHRLTLTFKLLSKAKGIQSIKTKSHKALLRPIS